MSGPPPAPVPRTRLAPDWRVHRHHATAEERQQAREHPVGTALGIDRDVARVSTRQPRAVLAGDVEGDLGARVAGTDDQHATGSQLGGVAVLARVKLHDLGVELAREVRHPGFVVRAGGHDDLCCKPPRLAGDDDVSVVVFGTTKAVDADSGSHRQLEGVRVQFEVVGHLVLGGEGVRRRRKGQPGQAVVAGWGEQAQRVPAVAPAVADPCVLLEDDEAQSATGKVVAHRQAGLAGANHDHVKALRRHVLRRFGSIYRIDARWVNGRQQVRILILCSPVSSPYSDPTSGRRQGWRAV